MCLKKLFIKLTNSKAIDQCTVEEKKFYETVYRLLYISGLSFYDNSFGYYIYSIIVKSLVGVFASSEIWYLFADCRTLNEVVANTSVTIINVLGIYRYWNMTKHMKSFLKLTKAMESPNFDISTKRRKEIVKLWCKQNIGHFYFLVILTQILLFIWNLKPLTDDIEYNLIVNLHLPITFDTPYRYPVVFIFIAVTFNYSALFVISNDLIMQTLLIHLICQFHVLADCFENVVVECALRRGRKVIVHANFNDKFNKRMCDLIDQHSFLLSNTEELKNILSIPMLGQLISSSMLICFSAYQVAAALNSDVVSFLTSLLYLVYNLFELFIFCRWCDEIRSRSFSIRESVYCCGWEQALLRIPGARSKLQFVIARASKPVILNAGGIWDLSLASYTTLIKNSYSALTVLLQMERASN